MRGLVQRNCRLFLGNSSMRNRTLLSINHVCALEPIVARSFSDKTPLQKHLHDTIPADADATAAYSNNNDSSTTKPRTDSAQLIHDMARQPQTSVSLQALMRTGQGEFLHRTFGEETRERHAATELVLIQVASFLRRELPIRLAHRIEDLEDVPVLSDMSSVRAVAELYKTSFSDLMALPPKIETAAQEELFAQTVENIYERHSSVLVQMARGAFEFRSVLHKKGKGDVEFELQEETHAFLDRFYLCRIGIRVLIGQYLALRQPPVPNYIGIICSQTSPYEIVKRAIDDAAFMCTRKYGDAPEVIMSGRLDMTFPYVPTHLRKLTGDC
jgi:pyruvate dehydrogenase kinase 2/3/4